MIRLMPRLTFAVWAAICGPHVKPVRAADPAFDYTLTGFHDSRQRLKTGVCVVQGRKVEIEPAYGRLEGTVQLFIAFDHEAGLTRFDRTEPIRVAPDGRRVPLPQTGWVVGTEIGKYVKTPDRSLTWINDDPKNTTKGAVVIRRPEAAPYKQASPFDIRIVGVGNMILYEKNRQLDALFAGLKSRAEEARVQQLDSSLTRLVFPSEIAETRIDFDESRQFVPVRCEVYEFGRDRMLAAKPSFESTTEWVKVSGVWVPAGLKLRYEINPKQEISYDLTFDWQRVNVPLPADLFQPRGMDLPDGLAILRSQPGKAGQVISLGRVGDLTPDPRLADSEPVPSDPRPWPRRHWPWLVAAVVVCAAGLVYLAFGGRTRP